jgi:polyisoprenoid-binding protein YceI
VVNKANPMTPHSLLALGALLVGAQALAQPSAAQLLPAQSEIVFTTRQMGVPVEGRFDRFSAQITLDPKKPEAGTVNFVIDTGSARFGSAELDGEVGKPIWLNVARFPQARFQSSAIRATAPGRFDVAGKLDIKGAVQDVVVPVLLARAGATSTASTASGSFTIKRLAFKIGEGEWSDTSLLADDVVVRFKLALTGLAAR